MGLENVDFNNIQNTAYSQNYINGYDKLPLKDLIFVKRSDGKICIMKKEDYIHYLLEQSKRIKPQVKPAKNEAYDLGPEKNGVRIVNVDNVSDPINRGTSAPSRNSCSPDKILEYENNIMNTNGYIDDFKQGKRGDCYLLAAIKSIIQTKDGQDILRKNIQENSDGSYTVTLPGAIAARNHYIESGYEDKCAITGKYIITASAINKAKKMSGKSYAYGDLEVILFELAMEAFRAEVLKTNKALGKKSEQYIAGQIGPMSESDTLSGGMMYDAVFLLTGQKSDLYQAPRAKRKRAKLYVPGEYGYVGQVDNAKAVRLGKSKRGIVEVNHVYNKDSDLQRMLDKYKGKESNYSITVSVIVAKNGPDGSTKAGGGHALTVTKITDEYVEVVNPWDTKKTERIPRGDFEDMAVRLNVAPISEKHYEQFAIENKINQPNLSNQNSLMNIINSIFPPHSNRELLGNN